MPNETHRPVSASTCLRPRCVFVALVLLSPVFTSGCANSRLNAARENFYLGRFDQAAVNLEKTPRRANDKVLVLMERGAIQQARGDYAASTRDWVDATQLAENLDYVSLSRSSASLAINDRVLAFRGAPYEQTLVHAFAAKSYLAMAQWDDAAVEARNIIGNLENLNGFPEEPYSRYLAGLCMELIRDSEGARLQYRTAASLLPHLHIDPVTGQFGAGTEVSPNATKRSELVCFIGIGRAPQESGSWPRNHLWGTTPYVEIFADGKYLGRSQAFSSTTELTAATEKRMAKLTAAKTAARIVLKEAASEALERENELLGELLRLYLFALETQGMRRWETLPLWLQIARLPCPAELQSFEIVLKGEGGRIIERRTVSHPLTHRDSTYVSFIRAF